MMMMMRWGFKEGGGCKLGSDIFIAALFTFDFEVDVGDGVWRGIQISPSLFFLLVDC